MFDSRGVKLYPNIQIRSDGIAHRDTITHSVISGSVGFLQKLAMFANHLGLLDPNENAAECQIFYKM